ncbi:MAG: hypothetical protein K9J13_06155 [Saprospiraceae bacterium]|nr:hypothetical protein [Saprospiraceae bacterium]
MKSKFFGYVIAFVLGAVFCLILVDNDRAWGPTELKVKQDLVFRDSMIIPKGTYIRKIRSSSAGFCIYATYFKSWGGYEKYIAEFDSTKKDILVTPWVIDSLLVKEK